MPWGRSNRTDPHTSIHSWDDGYEYIRPDSQYGPDGLPKPPLADPNDRYRNSRAQSPGSDGHTRRRRTRQDRSPPPASVPFRPPTPPRRREDRAGRDRDRDRDRDSRYPPRSNYDAHQDSFYPSRPSRRRTSSPSPSPPPRYRRYSESPPRHRNTRGASPGRDRDRDRDRRPPTSYRPPSPASSAGRPSLHRSKTTSTKERSRAYGRDGDQNRDHYRDQRDRDSHRRDYPPSSSSGEAKRRHRHTTDDAAAGGAAGVAAAASRPSIQRSKTTGLKDKAMSPRWQKAAVAALQAGGMAAMSMRSQPGAWKGEKGARVATAALGAMAMDAFNKKSGGYGTGAVKQEKARREDNVEELGGAISGMLLDRVSGLRKGKGEGRRGDRDRDRRT